MHNCAESRTPIANPRQLSDYRHPGSYYSHTAEKPTILSELGEANLNQNSMSAWPVAAKGEMAMINRCYTSSPAAKV
jgi:hypothetical protein